MKQTTKKKLIISVAVLSFISLTIWYYFPMLKGHLFIYKSSSLQKKYLNVRPTYIKELPKPPTTWETVSIDALVLELPISKFNKISGKEELITFRSDRAAISFVSLVPSKELLRTLKEMNLKYPSVSFDEDVEVLKVVPSDLSFFNSRDENKKISANLVLKAIAFNPEHFGEILIVNSQALKALCLISEKGENGYGAVVDLYSPNGAVLIKMALFWYKDKTTLNSDLLNILGGLTMPNQPLQAEKVENDINTIMKKYNRTEQIAQPDSQ